MEGNEYLQCTTKFSPCSEFLEGWDSFQVIFQDYKYVRKDKQIIMWKTEFQHILVGI